MKDLKHLIYLENMLQEACNDMVKQAKSEGKIAIGSVCSLIPEPLLDLPGCFVCVFGHPEQVLLRWVHII